VLVFVLALLDSLPFVTVAFSLYNWSEGFAAYLWEPVYAVVLVSIGAVQVLLVKWVVLGKLKPGTYDYPGWYWLRKWFSDKHLELASGLIVPIYDSLFARPWCIALGMKCGPRCEIALPRRMPYDLVEMGAESFLASEVSIGRPIRRNGKITLERTKVGTRSFLGNDSVVPQGSNVPDEFLLGVLSVCPRNDQIGTEKEQAWLGSPPFKLPKRQVHDQFDPKHTYSPTAKLYAQRLAHEAVRIVLPSLCSLIVASILIEGFVWIWNFRSLRQPTLSQWPCFAYPWSILSELSSPPSSAAFPSSSSSEPIARRSSLCGVNSSGRRRLIRPCCTTSRRRSASPI
jgi:non-ribosomal peptide synthetase-like protein